MYLTYDNTTAREPDTACKTLLLCSRLFFFRDDLARTKERLEESKARELENTMKIQKILQDMAMLEAEDCTQEKILRVLQEGLQAFSELEQQGGQRSTAMSAMSPT